MPDLSLSVLTYLGASWTDAAAGATIFLLKKFIVVVAVLSSIIIMDKSLYTDCTYIFQDIFKY